MEASKLTIRRRRLCGWHGVITTASVTAATVIMIMTIPFNGLFSRTTWVSQYEMGKTSLDLNEARDDGFFWCSDISWSIYICKQFALLLQADNHTSTSSLSFYRPAALPDAQPTVSKHCRHLLKILWNFQWLCLQCFDAVIVQSLRGSPCAKNVREVSLHFHELDHVA